MPLNDYLWIPYKVGEITLKDSLDAIKDNPLSYLSFPLCATCKSFFLRFYKGPEQSLRSETQPTGSASGGKGIVLSGETVYYIIFVSDEVLLGPEGLFPN